MPLYNLLMHTLSQIRLYINRSVPWNHVQCVNMSVHLSNIILSDVLKIMQSEHDYGEKDVVSFYFITGLPLPYSQMENSRLWPLHDSQG